MTPRQRRLLAVLALLGLLGTATALLLSAFSKNLVFFFTPTQLLAGEAPSNARLRVGGLVEPGSVQRAADGLSVRFAVTDGAKQVPVQYQGQLPDLFKEGKGVVAQGRLQQALFVADEVLAKHDENYMPPEALKALEAAQ
jgi:cytochrome c-type biogenesis protein CcmE